MTRTEIIEKKEKFIELAQDYLDSGMRKSDIKKALKHYKYSESTMNNILNKMKKQ